MSKKVNPVAVHALNEALSLAFWYKPDLRAFLSTTLPDNNLIPRLDWTEYKRNTVRTLLMTMASDQKYQDDLLTLMLATADIGDPAHLKRLDDGEKKYKDAKVAIDDLKSKVEPYRALRQEAEETSRRIAEEHARAELRQAVSEKLSELKSLFYEVVSAQDPQSRGYSLEKLIGDLFALFDIDAKASFKISGEQIDGAFTYEGTDYLFEAKWQKTKSTVAELDTFAGKISRKLENTLGLFLSINGFEETALETHSQNGSAILAMDGADLALVLEDRVDLQDLLTRKKQHASRTGQIMLKASELV